MDKKRVLIIDGNNLFLRNYTVNPTLSSSGLPIGGVLGFVKSLQKLCKFVDPNRIVVCWDGKDGSSNRRSLNKDYKNGRTAIRLNSGIHFSDENESLKNKIWQMTRTVEYLNNMPIIQILIDTVEADDLISIVCKHASLKKYNKIIVSNDKDFIQLCNEDTVLYRPVKEEVLNSKRILEQYDIDASNFCLARAICGDKSDNLIGVSGVGLPTVAKRIPILKSNKNVLVDDIISYCSSVESDLKIYKNILESINTIKENYKIMRLDEPKVNEEEVLQVEYALENSECIFNKTEILKLSFQDGFGELNLEDLFVYMRKIVLENC